MWSISDAPALAVAQEDVGLQDPVAPSNQAPSIRSQTRKLSGNSQKHFKYKHEQDVARKFAMSMHRLGDQQHNQVASCSDGLKKKLDELHDLNIRMEDLCAAANDLYQSFGAEDAHLRAEFKSQVESLERYQTEMEPIEGLRERLRIEKEKVDDYERRIGVVQVKIEKQRQKESSWKKRVSWRLRFFWGLVAMLVILWLLATSGGDDLSDTMSDDEPIKLVPPKLLGRAEAELEELSLV